MTAQPHDEDVQESPAQLLVSATDDNEPAACGEATSPAFADVRQNPDRITFLLVGGFDTRIVGGGPRRWWCLHDGRSYPVIFSKASTDSTPLFRRSAGRTDCQSGHQRETIRRTLSFGWTRATRAKVAGTVLAGAHRPSPQLTVDSRLDGEPTLSRRLEIAKRR